jgi:hypothetical protein
MRTATSPRRAIRGTRRTRVSLPQQCRRKFLRFFPRGFADETYLDWERTYKASASERWAEQLNPHACATLLDAGEYGELAARAVRIESRTNLLFSFEKMALRDAVKPADGAKRFAIGLVEFLYGSESAQEKFERWCECVAGLPRRQTRVLTWPVVTVFGFIGRPDQHIFLKPNVTRVAAKHYGYPFQYTSKPAWATYQSLLDFGEQIAADQAALRPRDMIDIQSFIWVQGSDEYD